LKGDDLACGFRGRVGEGKRVRSGAFGSIDDTIQDGDGGLRTTSLKIIEPHPLPAGLWTCSLMGATAASGKDIRDHQIAYLQTRRLVDGQACGAGCCGL
jgi:hypothetical protein